MEEAIETGFKGKLGQALAERVTALRDKHSERERSGGAAPDAAVPQRFPEILKSDGDMTGGGGRNNDDAILAAIKSLSMQVSNLEKRVAELTTRTSK